MSAEHTIDRTGWPVGPWDDEPDRAHWVDPETGLDCLIVRNWAGAWCGYVGVPMGHPWHGQGYNDVPADVHGGLTFTGPCQQDGPVCHTEAEATHRGVWWLGFDCNHYRDKAPGTVAHYAKFPELWQDGTYRDMGYVKTEVTGLARQVANHTDGNTILIA